MKKMLKLLPIVFIVWSFTSCNKAKNEKWLFADIEVRDKLSDQLINADLVLYYRYVNKKYDNDYEVLELGSTVDGEYQLEKQFTEKIEEAYIIAYGTEYYYSVGDYQQSNIDGPRSNISPFRHNDDVVIYLYPIYRMQVSVTNVNCFDATDSLRFYIVDPDTNNFENLIDTLVGCYDDTPVGMPTWSKAEYVQWVGYLKRNGFKQEVNTYYPLEPYTENVINIQY